VRPGPSVSAEFVPIAEESGLIVEIGACLYRLQQAAAWAREGYFCPEVSVNISGDQLIARALRPDSHDSRETDSRVIG
jgi:EAL domain-containing protein (putative c-di-GMP-specific phosphodiesterase class I)